MFRRPVKLPAATQAALARVFGDHCASVGLVEHSWRVRWHPRMHATTRRNRIFLRGTVEEFVADPALVLHEYFHVLEQWQPGRLTRWRYLVELLRRGYRANCFEVEARDYVDRNLGRFRRLLAEG
jgi:hypothetical protein